MHRLPWILSVLLVAACVSHLAGTIIQTGAYTATYSESQACTSGTCAGTTPTSANDAGANLAFKDGFRLRVCAPPSQTLSGAGTMQAWLCDVHNGACYRNLGLDQSVTASGTQCAAFPDFSTSYISEQADTVEFVASGVTVSGTDGGTLTEEIQTHKARQ